MRFKAIVLPAIITITTMQIGCDPNDPKLSDETATPTNAIVGGADTAIEQHRYAAASSHSQPAAASSRVSVIPVMFVPNNAEEPSLELQYRYYTHMIWARSRFLHLLEVDTFHLSDVRVYHAKNDDTHYCRKIINEEELCRLQRKPGRSDRFHTMMQELLDEYQEDRYGNVVFSVIYVRPNPDERHPVCYVGGGGRTFSFPDAYGGGLHMDIYDLIQNENFQSTLQHELGHAFGLTHANAHGYSMSTSESMMSYNPAHHTDGFTMAAAHGNFSPEDYKTLDTNQGVFPDFSFITSIHNPEGRNVDDTPNLGWSENDNTDLPGNPLMRGYELLFDGSRVGHEPFWSLEQAKNNCSLNRTRYPNIDVQCHMDGSPIAGYELFRGACRIGHEPLWTRAEAEANCAANKQAMSGIHCTMDGELL